MKKYKTFYKFKNKIFYININLIIKFISEQGKILFIRINKLTLKLKYKKLINIYIKKFRIISIIPFYLNKKKDAYFFLFIL
uniref:Ribosomal protein S18 n=1 Tax=Lophophytum leandri TaxID=1618140 RepID=A0A8E7MIQ1_9MAGN|nr:ribosomal protein S18 [Lophophytum leandri]